MEKLIKNIVKKQGGYREKDIMSKPHDVQKTETWNEYHKVVEILEKYEQEDGYRNGFAVDLVTNSICG